LRCYDNKLTTLIIHKHMTRLNCSHNKLTELIVPNSVTYLGCSGNRLTELIVPTSVVRLFCFYNLLEDLSKYNELIKPKVVSLYDMCHAMVNENNIPKCFSKVDKVTCDGCKSKVIKDSAYILYEGYHEGYIRKTIKCKKCF